MKYKYKGKQPINLAKYGKVDPKEVIEVSFSINHPLFKIYKLKTKKK